MDEQTLLLSQAVARIAELEAEKINAWSDLEIAEEKLIDAEAEVARLREAHKAMPLLLDSEVVALRAEVARLREALRECIPYVRNAIGPDESPWRIETAQGVLARIDDAMAGGGQDAQTVGERGEQSGATWESANE